MSTIDDRRRHLDPNGGPQKVRDAASAPDSERTPSVASKREFFRISAITGVGLTISIYLSGCTTEPVPSPEPPTSTPMPTFTPEPTATPVPVVSLEPNVYVVLDSTGTVTVKAFRSEMGQGIRTAIAMMLAEELDADWSSVRVEQAIADPAFGDQLTVGSLSVIRHYQVVRRAGAAARQVLVAAAAQEWGAEAGSCRTEKGTVIHPEGDRRLAYGELVEGAVGIPVPKPWDVALKEPKDFQIINTPRMLCDAPQMVDGSATYGLNVRLPDMLYATVARCPVFGGQVASFDASKARAMPGVRDVVEIESGVAVVADNTWAAIQGRDALEIVWDEGQHADVSSAILRESLIKPAYEVSAVDNPEVFEAAYDIPYLAHATRQQGAARPRPARPRGHLSGSCRSRSESGCHGL